MPPKPGLSRFKLPTYTIRSLGGIVRGGRQQVEKTRDGIRSIAQELRGSTATPPQKETETTSSPVAVATACVPCALGHFSTSAGLLNECVRFKAEGITSNEILDRIGKVLEEQNTLERVDLTPEKLQSAPQWEREIAEEALSQSRSLRHRLENLSNIEQLEQSAADTESFYKKFNREWFKRRFAYLGPEKAQRIAEEIGKLSPEDKERVLKRAEELIEEA